MGKKQEVLLLIIICIFIYIVGIFLVRNESKSIKSRVIKNVFIIYFVAYVMLLLKYTMFDSHFGREFGLWINRGNLKESYAIYFENRTNFKIFGMISAYFRAFFNENLSLRLLIINILGNIVAFMPLAIFLPIFFKWARRFWSFTLGVLMIGISVEVLQIILMTGAFDVDDILLNVCGALLAYGICRIKFIRNALNIVTFKNYK